MEHRGVPSSDGTVLVMITVGARLATRAAPSPPAVVSVALLAHTFSMTRTPAQATLGGVPFGVP